MRQRVTKDECLPAQCAKYGLILETIYATRDRDSELWIDASGKTVGPEDLVLNRFAADGFAGSWCEGGTLNLLLKAAAFPVLVKYNTFRDRVDSCRRFLEAQLVILSTHHSEILASISSATLKELSSAIDEILADPHIQEYYPNVRSSNVLSLWSALGPVLVTEIAKRFLAAPYGCRAGWPDLTLIRNGEVRFVEVKTTDLLHNSQFAIIELFAVPLKLPFSVTQVVSHTGV